jgi:hypothetical protein
MWETSYHLSGYFPRPLSPGELLFLRQLHLALALDPPPAHDQHTLVQPQNGRLQRWSVACLHDGATADGLDRQAQSLTPQFAFAPACCRCCVLPPKCERRLFCQGGEIALRSAGAFFSKEKYSPSLSLRKDKPQRPWSFQWMPSKRVPCRFYPFANQSRNRQSCRMAVTSPYYFYHNNISLRFSYFPSPSFCTTSTTASLVQRALFAVYNILPF